MSLPTCFVVTGFGTKTDPSTGRALNLDQTFKQLVQPACDNAGINAFRAIDANVTGSIDAIMYRWIYAADYVIADLSTLNANVFYELGVRHAQRPNTTVIIAEEMLLSHIPFDLSSFVIHAYAHGGARIAKAEATRFVDHLSGVLTRVRRIEETRRAQDPNLQPETDSPVFKFLAGMTPPDYTADSFLAPPAYVPPADRETAEREAPETLAGYLEAADAAIGKSSFDRAVSLLNDALDKVTEGAAGAKPDTHLIHRLALATYKAGEASKTAETEDKLAALTKAEALLERHTAPKLSTDPETLGLSGAINKRFFDHTGEVAYLERAIHFYERGFYIKQDTYNGINAAFMHTLRAVHVEDGFEATVSYGYANMLRRKIVALCQEQIADPEAQGGGLTWVYATLAEAYLGLGDTGEVAHVERKMKQDAQPFAIESYEAQKARLETAMADFAARTDIATTVSGSAEARRPAERTPDTPATSVTDAREYGASGRITIVPDIEPGRDPRSVEITCKITYD